MSDHIHYGSSEYWGALRDIAVGMNDRIYRGLAVAVVGGRKHKGRRGTVTRHQRSPYEQNVFRYGSPAHADLAIMRGREGFVALVTPNDDGDPRPFWVPCKHLMPVCDYCGPTDNGTSCAAPSAHKPGCLRNGPVPEGDARK